MSLKIVPQKRSKRLAVIGIIAITLVISSCSRISVGGGIGYQPPIIPVRFSVAFSVEPDGSVSFTGGVGIVTDVGTFSADVDFDETVHPVDGETLLVIQHHRRSGLVDSVFRIATWEELVVTLNGHNVVYLSNHKIVIDVSRGRVASLIVKNAETAAPSVATSQPAAPPPASGDVAPSTDPGQIPVPSGATVLGSVNLENYCQNLGMHAVLRFPNAWGWRCSLSSAQASGERLGDQDISVTSACVEQYGDSAISHYRDYNNANSWFCFSN